MQKKAAESLQSASTTEFWKQIKNIDNHVVKRPCRVDDAKTEEDICELWRNKYATLLNSVDSEEARNTLHESLRNTHHDPVQFVTPEEVCIGAESLSNNKSMGLDGIPSEVYKYAPFALHAWIAALFNECFKHCHIPSRMTEVFIIPIVKSNQKSPMDSTNYRPIAISPSISKIFEDILLTRLHDFIQCSHHQFGFKKQNSTETCIFAMREVINYYKQLNSNVFICFIDIKGAFDRVNYMKLFCKMLQRGVPTYLILLLENWYTEQKLFVKWNNSMSQSFGMKNAIRQGSKLSPYLFNVYIDELNEALCNSKVGCHIAGKAANNFGYADDLALAAPSAKALNTLLEICDNFAARNDIVYSTAKSVCMMVPAGTRATFEPPDIHLSGSTLQYVTKFKYLGHIITNSMKDDEDIMREIRSLNARGNVIIRKFGFLSLEVKCQLFKTYCYPLYTCALWSNYNQGTLNRLKVAYNNIMRRLAHVPPWSSASHMFGSLGVRSFQETLRNCSYSLMRRIDQCPNNFIQVLSSSDASRLSRHRNRWISNLF